MRPTYLVPPGWVWIAGPAIEEGAEATDVLSVPQFNWRRVQTTRTGKRCDDSWAKPERKAKKVSRKSTSVNRCGPPPPHVFGDLG
jgi:hypothetical protein